HLFAALVAIDSPEVADYVAETLRALENDAQPHRAVVVADALREVLPAHADGRVAARIEPWVFERLEASDVDQDKPASWQGALVHRVAGIYGAKAIPALIESIERVAHS